MSELKRIAQDLNLTEQQVERLRSATRDDIIAKVKEHRVEIRQRVENFVSLEQNGDAETTKARNSRSESLPGVGSRASKSFRPLRGTP